VLFAVVVRDPETRAERDCVLAGFGAVICPICEEPFIGHFQVGDKHVCGGEVVSIRTDAMGASQMTGTR
jgi:hypothetical protein